MIVVTGGGTGGHLKVAKAIIDELYSRGIFVIFIGSSNGADKAWFEKEKHISKAFFLETQGVVNKGILGKIKSLWNIVKATDTCYDIFVDNNIKKVISVGGYSAAPASFATLFCSAKLYIHEQNSVMGKLNKITSKFARFVYSSYDPNSPIKDYPVANEFFEEARIRQKVKTIIFLGGSQGARAINDYALSIAQKLKQMGIHIIHQAGKNDIARVQEQYEKMGIEVDVFGFSTSLIEKMSQADFAVSRAGASTLWELCANALPTLFVPYPYAASDHQYHNAKFLEQKNLGYVCRQENLQDFDLFGIIQNDQLIHSLSKGLVDTVMIDGVKLLVTHILEDQ